jgi:predicted chitinase
MPVKFNVNKTIELWKKNGGTSFFEDSLKDVLRFMQNDKNISNLDEASYFLATAKVESDYSLQRWEADYLCGKKGVAYDKKPCEKAINYYRSSNGKKNYFDLGTDKKGLPYFGRGLIQLTGKSNYQKYGDKIGVNLVDDGDKALDNQNSYNIASAYLKERTFKHLAKGDLTQSRKSVNGGTNGLDEVNKSYKEWVKIFENKKPNFKGTKYRRKTRQAILISTLISVIGIAYITTKLIKRQ